MVIANEQIEQQAADVLLKQQLFAPLDQDQSVKQQLPTEESEKPTAESPAGAATTPEPKAKEASGLSDDDIEAELKRNLGTDLEE